MQSEILLSISYLIEFYIKIIILHFFLIPQCQKNKIKHGRKLSSTECQSKSRRLTSLWYADYHLSKLYIGDISIKNNRNK